MVRVLCEVSVPAQTVADLEAFLAPGSLPAGFTGRLAPHDRFPGCESPAAGGSAAWTPCWVSVETEDDAPEPLGTVLRALKARLAAACRQGGVELYAVPASVQIGDGFYRLRDLEDVAARLG